ncbi:MAG: cupin domain-containing protein [Nitrosopumilus sp.]|nr:cupin domain-containing protein [Nitrosopumilus sp.]MDH3502060.1 cupin domain-containing protein [Nitrosopumilus sp.]
MKLDFNVDEYIKKIKDGKNFFHTFINRDTLAAGVLVLQPGEKDTQKPHENDEVYFVLKGNGFLKIKEKDYPISKNKMYFVGKKIKHYFHGNSQELVVLYFFGGHDT